MSSNQKPWSRSPLRTPAFCFPAHHSSDFPDSLSPPSACQRFHEELVFTHSPPCHLWGKETPKVAVIRDFMNFYPSSHTHTHKPKSCQHTRNETTHGPANSTTKHANIQKKVIFQCAFLKNQWIRFSYHSQLFLSALHKHRSPPSAPACRAGLSAWGAPEQSWFSSAATRKPRCSCAAESASGTGEWLPVHGTTGTQENLWDREISSFWPALLATTCEPAQKNRISSPHCANDSPAQGGTLCERYYKLCRHLLSNSIEIIQVGIIQFNKHTRRECMVSQISGVTIISPPSAWPCCSRPTRSTEQEKAFAISVT